MRTLIAAAAAVSLLAAPQSFAARFPQAAPATTNNADSCDLGNFPAATLLLPYFEVDTAAPENRTLLFTVTNTSPQPQIAKVVLWTDYGYPVLDFDIFLTGYDVQSLNLADILVRGVIAPPSSTSIDEPAGTLSAPNTLNPHFAPNVGSMCAQGLLPGRIPPSLLADVRSALTNGTASSCGTARIGGSHRTIFDRPSTIAIGYATIDVVATCTATLPTEEAYWNELLYDNVLAGDYQQLAPANDGRQKADATGNPMVHIRAVPDGGAAGAIVGTNLPLTFYGRLTPRTGPRTRDRRQPLPSVFAARFVESPGFATAPYFGTTLKIWRDREEGSPANCSSYIANRDEIVAEMVRFDEHENPTVYPPPVILDPRLKTFVTLPLTSATSTSNTAVFPPLSGSGDNGGWLYLDLNFGTPVHDIAPSVRNQAWVTVSMSQGLYATEFDAIALGNGCSPVPATTMANNGNGTLGPLPDQTP